MGDKFNDESLLLVRIETLETELTQRKRAPMLPKLRPHTVKALTVSAAVTGIMATGLTACLIAGLSQTVFTVIYVGIWTVMQLITINGWTAK